MNILIVGSVIKDVYLNLDDRTEKFETDKHNTKWLNLGFNSSIHHFYNRHSSFGGAAISMQVLKQMELNATISNSDFNLNDTEKATTFFAKSYRYILITDDNVSYLVSSEFEHTTFKVPTAPIDYLYIDRSAVITQSTAAEIAAYLENNPNIKLIVYLKNPDDPYLSNLNHRATLTFGEKKSPELDFEKTIYLSDKDLSFKNITEPITLERIDKLTHLSAYSIAAATILGSFILGNTVEDSLKMARANLENSNLDSVLSLTELKSLSSLPEENLELIAASLVVPKKGILAADESGGSIKKKFAELNIEDTFENRHNYRNIFFTTPNIENYVTGVILFDETVRDFVDDGQTVVDYLISRRIVPGIKVDQGLEKFSGSEETYTKGLDGLPGRLREYYKMGLRFAKWRAAFNLTVSNDGKILTPTADAITENCRILAEYAYMCQSAGIVPIVEPEVVYDGDYSIEKNVEVTGNILDSLFSELRKHDVNLKACILKVNMILAGKRFNTPSTTEEVGQATAEVLKNHVPEDLAGVVFLSGGQTPEQATDNLAAVLKNGPFPWPVTFSFARALQDPALHAWNGDSNNNEKARQAFLDRLIANSKAL